MGYEMYQRDVRFRIPADRKAGALAAIKALRGKETCRDSYGGHFAWVDTSDFRDASTLEAMLDAWGWKVTADENGNLVHITFEREKAGDEDLLWGAIAPFVAAGSYITMQGEGGESWRWWFDGKQCLNQPGRVTFPANPSEETRG